MLRLAVLILATFSSCLYAAPDFYEALNRLRSGEGACGAFPRQLPLLHQPALEQAARALARGGTLRSAMQEAGYRDIRSLFVSVTGDDVDGQAVPLLEQKYCEQIRDAGLTEAGVYRNSRQLWIVLAAPFAPGIAAHPERALRRALALVNEARASARSCGAASYGRAPPVRWNDALARAALAHSEDMARRNYFGHRGSDGSHPAERVRAAGYAYRATAENIAAGPLTPEDAVAQWIASPPHCANLMHPGYSEMGVAFAVDRSSEFGVYWTQVFGAPR